MQMLYQNVRYLQNFSDSANLHSKFELWHNNLCNFTVLEYNGVIVAPKISISILIFSCRCHVKPTNELTLDISETDHFLHNYFIPEVNKKYQIIFFEWIVLDTNLCEFCEYIRMALGLCQKNLYFFFFFVRAALLKYI